MGFRRPFYAKGRLKVAWILYKTVAWALPTGNVCRNDGEWYGGFSVFAGKAHATTAVHLVFDTALLSAVIPAQAGIHF